MTKSNIICLLLFFCIVSVWGQQPIGERVEISTFDYDFEPPELPFLFAPDSIIYTLIHNTPTEVEVDCNVPEENFQGFVQILFNDTTGVAGFIDVSNRAFLSLVVRAEEPIRLRADLADTTGTPTDTLPENQEVFLTGNDATDTITFEFAPNAFNEFITGTDVDSTAIGSVILVVNPGGAPYNGSLFIDRMVLGGLITTTSIEDQLSISLGTNIYPNPSNTQMSVAFSLENAAKVEWTILDLQGKMIQQRVIGMQSTGKHTHTIATEGLSSGLYLLRIQVDDVIANPIKFMVE